MDLLNLLFPKRCVGCGRVGGYVCSDCVNRMKVVEKQICPSCGEGSMFGVVHSRCKTAWGLDGVVRVLVYKGVVKRMIGKIKYKGVFDLFGEVVEAVVSLGEMTALE